MIIGCGVSEKNITSVDPLVKEDKTLEEISEEEDGEEAKMAEEDSENRHATTDEMNTSDERLPEDKELPEDEGIGDGGFREVTMQELVELSTFVEQMDAYGFLMSEYSIPEEADLGQVFYSGAGKAGSMENEEYAAYLKAMNQEEMFTDCVKVSKGDAQDVVMRRLGVDLEEMNTENIGVYLPEYDAYYHECGDTNYMKYSCVDGLVNNNIYTVEFTAATNTGWEFETVQTVLEKTEEGYRFISNMKME